MAVAKISAVDFDHWVELPENAERRLELIEGEIIEAPSNPYSSQVTAFIIAALVMFVRPRNLGHVTGESAGYMIGEHRVSPDVVFVSRERQESLARRGYNPVAPDLAVEVVSPTDEQPDIRIKLGIYAKAGVLVWLVYPERELVEVYAPDEPVKIIERDGILHGGKVLPGFSLPVGEIFTQ